MFFVRTKKTDALTNDFFTNLLDMGTEWKAVSEAKDVFEGPDHMTGERKWTATRVGLVFGSNAQLRAVADVYGSADAQEEFVHDFVAAWTKVMNLVASPAIDRGNGGSTEVRPHGRELPGRPYPTWTCLVA